MSKLLDQCTIENGNINYGDFTFKLKYLIFGSKNSLDFDVMVWIPEELTLQPSHKFIQMCEKLDVLLYPILNNWGKDEFSKYKPINSCCGHWNITENSNKLKWTQKGSELAETNNSIILTFEKHKQMYDVCPFTDLIPRDYKKKVLGAVRQIVGKFSRTKLERPELDKFICEYIQIPKFSQIDVKKYTTQIFSGLPNIHFGTDKNTLNKIKQQRNTLTKKLIKVIKDHSSEHSPNDYYSSDTCDNNSLQTLVSELLDLIDYSDIFRRLVKYTMQMRLLGIYLDFLLLVDITKLIFPPSTILPGNTQPFERFKTISFQLGQTVSLIDGVELFDKDDVSNTYPSLSKFLHREHGNVENLNRFIEFFIDKVEDCFDEDFNRLSSETL